MAGVRVRGGLREMLGQEISGPADRREFAHGARRVLQHRNEVKQEFTPPVEHVPTLQRAVNVRETQPVQKLNGFRHVAVQDKEIKVVVRADSTTAQHYRTAVPRRFRRSATFSVRRSRTLAPAAGFRGEA